MRTLALFACLALMLFSLGCQGKRQYDWCDYSNTYYAIAKHDCEETRVKHKAELERIVETAAKKQLQVPPGVYAEYGFLLFKSGKSKEALVWYQKERELYPEASVFLDMLSRVAQKEIDKQKASSEDAPVETPVGTSPAGSEPVVTQSPATQG